MFTGGHSLTAHKHLIDMFRMKRNLNIEFTHRSPLRRFQNNIVQSIFHFFGFIKLDILKMFHVVLINPFFHGKSHFGKGKFNMVKEIIVVVFNPTVGPTHISQKLSRRDTRMGMRRPKTHVKGKDVDPLKGRIMGFHDENSGSHGISRTLFIVFRTHNKLG